MHWNVDGAQGLRLQRWDNEALHWLHNASRRILRFQNLTKFVGFLIVLAQVKDVIYRSAR